MYQKLYEDGIVIVEDFFDDYTKVNANEPMYPQPLFSCSKAQANYVTKTSVSRELIFDGVVRSQTTCGYDSYIVNSKSVSGSKKTKVTGPCHVASVNSLYGFITGCQNCLSLLFS